MTGAIVGAFIVIAMEHCFAGLGSRVTVMQGLIFVFCVLAFRRGVVGTIAAVLARRNATGG